jgi:hypothetical protein
MSRQHEQAVFVRHRHGEVEPIDRRAQRQVFL